MPAGGAGIGAALVEPWVGVGDWRVLVLGLAADDVVVLGEVCVAALSEVAECAVVVGDVPLSDVLVRGNLFRAVDGAGGTVTVVAVDRGIDALVDNFAVEGAEFDDTEFDEAVPRPGTVTTGPLVGAAADDGSDDAALDGAEVSADDAVELIGSATVDVPQAAMPRAATQSRAADRRTGRRARMGPQCQ